MYGAEKKSGKTLLTILVVILLPVYLLLAPSRIEESYGFRRVWTVNLHEVSAEGGAVSKSETGHVFPFVGSRFFGYLDEEGRVLFREEILFDVAVSQDSFINYSRMGESLVYRSPNESFFYRIDGEGYPVYRRNRLFLLSHDRMSIISIAPGGESRFRLDFPSLITSLDAGPKTIAVGLLNGTAAIHDLDGKRITVLQPTEDKRPVYAVALSPKGSYVALVRGYGPQQLTVFRKKSGEVKELKRWSTEEAILREVLLRFSDDERLLFREKANGIERIDLAKMEAKHIPFKAGLFDIHAKGLGHPILIVGNDAARGRILLCDDEGEIITDEMVRGGIPFSAALENDFLITAEDKAVRIEGVRM